MIRPLSTLIIEDSEADAILLLEELNQNGFKLVHERVESASELETALARRQWDVILCDYSLPQFSAPEALKLVRTKGLDVPFITVSGTYGEEYAVDMMKAGADDYIVKDKLTRLAPAIERELDAAQVRRARNKAEAAMQYLAAIVESTDDAVYGKTLDGVIVSWNAGAQRIYGYAGHEMTGQSISALFPPDRSQELDDILARVSSGEQVGRYETIRVRKDGSHVHVWETVSPIRDGGGKVIGASGIARDISDRKRDEEERLRLIQELTASLTHVKVLKGLLPICASCKKIRDDHGYWLQVETYIQQRSDAEFTHGICPDCMKHLYPEYVQRQPKPDGTTVL